ncbi:unnamed protein product [Chironomus riparius]|uniref:Uncharacterized protein n=1 Tax=Chironomus riparius TaxID=315576 RepID=A0A9N9RHW8_9DIPT|nr:unnamed protein product [Chironomus riparius]
MIFNCFDRFFSNFKIRISVLQTVGWTNFLLI